MEYFVEIIRNKTIGTALLACVLAQMLKVVFVLIFERRLNLPIMLSAGGMPSSHSAFVTSLAVFVGRTHGFDSALFAICAVFAFIVMYDASGVRRAAGEQAKIINRLVELWFHPDTDLDITDEKLKELIGHTPFEVLVGAFLGIIVGLLVKV